MTDAKYHPSPKTTRMLVSDHAEATALAFLRITTEENQLRQDKSALLRKLRLRHAVSLRLMMDD